MLTSNTTSMSVSSLNPSVTTGLLTPAYFLKTGSSKVLDSQKLSSSSTFRPKNSIKCTTVAALLTPLEVGSNPPVTPPSSATQLPETLDSAIRASGLSKEEVVSSDEEPAVTVFMDPNQLSLRKNGENGKYAGARFQTAPLPSQLPKPRFAPKKNLAEKKPLSAAINIPSSQFVPVSSIPISQLPLSYSSVDLMMQAAMIPTAALSHDESVPHIPPVPSPGHVSPVSSPPRSPQSFSPPSSRPASPALEIFSLEDKLPYEQTKSTTSGDPNLTEMTHGLKKLLNLSAF